MYMWKVTKAVVIILAVLLGLYIGWLLEEDVPPEGSLIIWSWYNTTHITVHMSWVLLKAVSRVVVIY